MQYYTWDIHDNVLMRTSIFDNAKNLDKMAY
jgi:hypothetical protein